jgi:ppGpp synthetase/RelA/SpoT-type nucleotidyltranferase
MGEESTEKLNEWYKSEQALYEGLTNVVHYLLESLIRNAKIDYLSVTSRTKSIESVLEKMDRKEYDKPTQEIMDFAGIRVITFIDSDVRKVCDLIKGSFKVHESNSLDKLDELGIDRFGYRSVHFVCELGDDRTRLPEFSLYENRRFEVQVRTALQHAWAEMEHDRNYKFSGVLPTPLQRRLHFLAGVLEMVDREFVSIAAEVDQYAEEVSKKTQSGDLDVEINTTSLLQYLPEKMHGIEISSYGLQETRNH